MQTNSHRPPKFNPNCDSVTLQISSPEVFRARKYAGLSRVGWETADVLGTQTKKELARCSIHATVQHFVQVDSNSVKMDLRSGPVEGRREDREQGGRERGTGQHNGEGGPGPLQVCMCMSDRVGSWPMHGRAHKHTHTHVCTSVSLPMCMCWSMQHRRGRVNLLSGWSGT